MTFEAKKARSVKKKKKTYTAVNIRYNVAICFILLYIYSHRDKERNSM